MPLKVNFDKLHFYWNKVKLVVDKENIKKGHSLKIYFKILDFNGNY